MRENVTEIKKVLNEHQYSINAIIFDVMGTFNLSFKMASCNEGTIYLTFAPRNHNKSYGLKGRKTRMNTGFLV